MESGVEYKIKYCSTSTSATSSIQWDHCKSHEISCSFSWKQHRDAQAARNISEISEMTPKPLRVHTLFLQFVSMGELLPGLTDAPDKDVAVLQGSGFTGRVNHIIAGMFPGKSQQPCWCWNWKAEHHVGWR